MDNNSKHVSSVVPAIIQGSGSLGAVLILFIVSFIIKCPKDGISECSWINLFFFVFVANSFTFFLLAYFYYSNPLATLLKGLRDYCAKFFKPQPENLDEIIDDIP
jgi:fructose-specific phosphotransferase system IIC component